MGFYIFLAVLIGAVVGVTAYFLARWIVRRRMAESLATALFLIKIPRAAPTAQPGNSENKDFKAELAHFEQLLGAVVAFVLAEPKQISEKVERLARVEVAVQI